MKFLRYILLPFKWLFNKVATGLKYVFIDKSYKVFLVLIPNFLFGILGVSILFYNFKNYKDDTTSLTNYGFAILIGLASVCFSWARGINKEDESEVLERVTKSGESFLHCAIIFLLLSAIKYATLHLEIIIPKDWKITYEIFNFSLIFAHSFGFTLGFYKVDKVICNLNLLLYERGHT